MQRGLIDLVIVGADRVTARGDVANKIGTYLKALAAQAHGIPFYVAFVGNSIDWTIEDGIADIPIEQRSAREVTHVTGAHGSKRGELRVTPEGVTARNDAFDVTPAKLITALITERGSCKPSTTALKKLFRNNANATQTVPRSGRSTKRTTQRSARS
jgi:methylthioribose-1-phosphate isomerase